MNSPRDEVDTVAVHQQPHAACLRVCLSDLLSPDLHESFPPPAVLVSSNERNDSYNSLSIWPRRIQKWFAETLEMNTEADQGLEVVKGYGEIFGAEAFQAPEQYHFELTASSGAHQL